MTIEYINYGDNGKVAREKINKIFSEVEASIPSIGENGHWYIGGVDTGITAVGVELREGNNLIKRDANLKTYTDLQIATGIAPEDNFDVGVTVGKILEEDGWNQDGLILNRRTTNGDYARWIYGNDGKLYFDCGDGEWNHIYLASNVDDLFTALRNDLGAVAFSNDYNDLDHKPVIGNGKLSIQRNGVLVNEITMNSTSNVTANISVPTKTSDISNDAGYITKEVSNLTNYTPTSSLGAVATSNDYEDLNNKPTIPDAVSDLQNDLGFIDKDVDDLTNYTKTSDLPTVGTAQITIQKNGTKVDDFGVNATSDKTINITVSKTDVGLGNVDNTSDLNKPISTATQNALNGKQATISDLSTIRDNATAGKSASDTIATYGDIVTHDADEFATSTQGGKADTAVQPGDLGAVAFSNDFDDLDNKPVVGDATITIQKNSTNVDSFKTNATANKTINITINKSDVGLSNVDNTSDADKPISTATQTALDGKQATISDLSTIRSNATAGKSASDTIATYGDVVTHDASEFASASQGALADTAVQPGDLGTVATSNDYGDLDNKPTIGDATITIQKNSTNVDSFKTNATANKTINITVSKTDVGLGNVDNTSDADKPVSTATQSALDLKQDVLVAGTNIQIANDGKTISATDTTYTAGTGLSLSGTEFSNTGVLSVNGNTGAVTINQVSDAVYGSNWNGVTDTAPSKNAVYDKINSIDTSVSAIEGKIPNSATASNQLADKDFVNSSINSVTAYYITKNAQGDQFATHAELASATTFYSGGVVRVPTRNDYCIVAVDEDHDNATTRYVYQGGQWEYQYTVNETALTQAQLNALNSGITSGKVTSYDGAVSTIGGYGNIVTHNVSEFATSTQGGKADTALQPNDNISELTNDAGFITSSALPTKVSDLTNDSGFITSSALSGYQTTANMVTDLTNPDNSHYPTTKAITDALVNLGAGDMLKSVYDPNNVGADVYDYTNFINTPTIPTVNNSKITIQKNGTKVEDFTLNQSTAKTINITVPTKTSDITNDSGFITSSSLPTKTSDLTNDSGFITSSAIPTNVSAFTNDAGYITSSALPTATSDLTNDSGFITSADIPTNISSFTNDSGYITSSAIPTNVSAFTNDAGYITGSGVIKTSESAGQTITSTSSSETTPLKLVSNNSSCYIAMTGKNGFLASYGVGSDKKPKFYNGTSNTLAFTTDIPTNVSSLTNDSGYITSASLPTKTSDLTNDSGFITSASLPTKTSDLTNDSGFITSANIPTNVSAFTNDAGYITSASLPTVNNKKITIQKNGAKVDDFTLNQSTDKTINITVPTKVSDITNDSGFITKNVNDLVNYTLTTNLASVATSGDYGDLNNLPTIPADTADLTNGAGFITAGDLSHGSGIGISGTTISNTGVLSVNGSTGAVTVTPFAPGNTGTAGQVLTKTSNGYQYSNIPSQVSDTAYGSSWDGDTTHAPSKNAIYDVLGNIETLLANI